MLPDLHQLIEKVGRLAELAHSLRRENAELRLAMAELSAENEAIRNRMLEAHGRIEALIERLPSEEAKQEAA